MADSLTLWRTASNHDGTAPYYGGQPQIMTGQPHIMADSLTLWRTASHHDVTYRKWGLELSEESSVEIEDLRLILLKREYYSECDRLDSETIM